VVLSDGFRTRISGCWCAARAARRGGAVSSRGARSRRVAIVTAVLAVLAVSCAAPPPVPSSIAIGASLPLSGPMPPSGGHSPRLCPGLRGGQRRGRRARAAGHRARQGRPGSARRRRRSGHGGGQAPRPGPRRLPGPARDGVRRPLGGPGCAGRPTCAPLRGERRGRAGLARHEQRWVFVVRATGDREARAYQTAKALLHALERASASTAPASASAHPVRLVRRVRARRQALGATGHRPRARLTR